MFHELDATPLVIFEPFFRTRVVNAQTDDLAHWCRDKMTAILRTTIANQFSWMKIVAFLFEFHWNLLPGSNKQ